MTEPLYASLAPSTTSTPAATAALRTAGCASVSSICRKTSRAASSRVMAGLISGADPGCAMAVCASAWHRLSYCHPCGCMLVHVKLVHEDLIPGSHRQHLAICNTGRGTDAYKHDRASICHPTCSNCLTVVEAKVRLHGSPVCCYTMCRLPAPDSQTPHLQCGWFPHRLVCPHIASCQLLGQGQA